MEEVKKFLKLNVNEQTEKKNGLTYLSWAWAWAKAIEIFPTATYTIKKDANGIPAFGNDKIGYMCYTTVTIGEITHEMWLPVMDHRNKTILQPQMFDINKTVMRCLTKNLAMFGLGLYIYAGEDLPEDEVGQPQQAPVTQLKKSTKPQLISTDQALSLVTLTAEVGSDLSKLLGYYKLDRLEDMTVEVYQQATKALEAKRA
jgi:hypothetical protein